ncbi:MAG: phytanoyl-CoA dioxygenase family protein [Bryobacteraceae bacterium]
MNGEYRDQFERDGFIVLREFLTSVEIDSLRDGWRRFVRDIAPGMDKAHVMYEDYEDADTLKQADCLHLEPSLDAWRHGGKIRELAEMLIGPVAPQHGEYFDKPPRGSKETPAHQDGYYFCLKPNLACTIWIPLETVDEENGALTYIRGSHRHGVYEHGDSSILGFSQGLTGDMPRNADHVICSAQPGDVLVHHSLTVHYAGRNRSNSRRRPSIAYVFFSASSQRDEVAWDRYQRSLEKQRLAKGIAHTESVAG